ncbi:D-2-hydroxyacid dehydrogenase [Altericroceibacterium xinjiangense]|uniref:D-2-hydroxyacid dehydrogenase n=1 Tax=Altericroceibacterium xinjiangense TaxID=762261 RepID=UPI001F4A013D|nr:D-2-hydroxyacid dehydrogenase [Altericroceibacterium xinjiangense]
MLRALDLAKNLRWLNSNYAGVDWMPLRELDARGVTVTCGSGLTSTAVAEFAVMGMLTVAKNYRAVVRAQDRHEWLQRAPGTRELAGSRALILGAGAIGQAIARMLRGFEVEVVAVSRSSGQDWRSQLGTFDWIVLAVPGTAETRGMIGAAEIAAMKPEAVLANFARADVIDQDALIAALEERRIEAALLDLTDPEPLPSENKLWTLENAHITMHLSGIPTKASLKSAAERFIRNCGHFRRMETLQAEVDLRKGY